MTNKQEKLIRALYTRQGRKKHNMCICEGLRACTELAKTRPDLISFALKSEKFKITEDLKSLEFTTIPENEFRKISATVTSQGIMIIAERPQIKSVEKKENRQYALVLDKVADPGNMGTIIRTAKAAGLKNIYITSGSADPFADKVIRAAMAAQFAVDIIKFANLAEAVCELRNSGYNTFWKTDPHNGKSLYKTDDLFANSAIIIGGEASGVSDHPDCKSVTIPMPGNSESINAAQAATIFMFEAVRREGN
jgi:TrmH family RNA methyltransferase